MAKTPLLPHERAVLEWIRNAHPALADVLRAQIENVCAVECEYTGAGAFTTLHVEPGTPPLPAQWCARFVAFDGPDLLSPELEAGAATTLHVDRAGFMDSIEIWSKAGDYPDHRHPMDITLDEPRVNHVDLR